MTNDEIRSTNGQMHALTRCFTGTLLAVVVRHSGFLRPYSFVIYDETCSSGAVKVGYQ